MSVVRDLFSKVKTEEDAAIGRQLKQEMRDQAMVADALSKKAYLDNLAQERAKIANMNEIKQFQDSKMTPDQYNMLEQMQNTRGSIGALPANAPKGVEGLSYEAAKRAGLVK